VTALEQERIETPRLVLVPLESALRRSILDGDPTGLAHADGWPHADTRDALAAGWPVWLVVAGDVVIGECGTVGGVTADGTVEIGLGLAAEHRGRGIGTDVIAALAAWLERLPQVRKVIARIEPGNAASRRAFAKAGFVHERGSVYVRRGAQSM
jgi:RimJ/RimL family protein N-acetyltransferase